MNPKFQAAIEPRDDVVTVKLAGEIDEDNDLDGLVDKLAGAKMVLLDLAEVSRINSGGVRDWVNWLARVEKGGATRIIFVECSPTIVAQVNLVHNFTGGGAIKSFYAPYFCPACNREKLLLLEARDLVNQRPFRAPISRCDECDGMMDFDDLEGSYFGFLGHAGKVLVESGTGEEAAALRELTPSTGEGKLKLRSNPGGFSPSPPPASGGLPLAPALPAAPRLGDSFVARTPTGPAAWPPPAVEETIDRLGPPPAEPQSIGAWIVVGILVAIALGLLVYVFVTGEHP